MSRENLITLQRNSVPFVFNGYYDTVRLIKIVIILSLKGERIKTYKFFSSINVKSFKVPMTVLIYSSPKMN